jgi:hypothetical protein
MVDPRGDGGERVAILGRRVRLGRTRGGRRAGAMDIPGRAW